MESQFQAHNIMYFINIVEYLSSKLKNLKKELEDISIIKEASIKGKSNDDIAEIEKEFLKVAEPLESEITNTDIEIKNVRRMIDNMVKSIKINDAGYKRKTKKRKSAKKSKSSKKRKTKK